LSGNWVPPRFILFAAVGAIGTQFHLSILSVSHRILGVGFVVSQIGATLVAMVGNFALNNELTYRDQRLRGRRWLTGCISFMLACSVGALANVGVAGALYAEQTNWLVSAIAGIVVGTVWNYAATAFYTWGRR
jgi:dolichol-phosphate mannosyltransferase